VIGAWPLARQQRTLLLLFGAGLLGLVLTAVAGHHGQQPQRAQVAAAAQATTQSQRLAKSVSQALVGMPAAFPEVKESRRAGAQRAQPEDRRRRRAAVPGPAGAGRHPAAAGGPRREERRVVLGQQKT
jgi:twitching motility protein PilJ